MDKALFDRTVNALLPDMHDPDDRKARIEAALYRSPVLIQIDWTGAAQPFTVRLVQILIAYGEIRADMPAISALLEDWKKDIGGGKRQTEFEALIHEVMENQSQKDDSSSALPSQPLPPPSVSPRTSDHIFISYAHTDRAWVERLANDLRERGYIVWIDFAGLRGGEVWRQSISDGIHASAVVLLILSPDSVRSEWVGIEVGAALKAGKKLIPLRVRPFTTADETAYQRMNIAHIQYREFTTGYEAAFGELLRDLPKPAAGIAGHCRKIAARLASLPWGLDHYIQEAAKLLPINARPYDEGGIRGQRENLMARLKQGSRMIVLGEPGIGKTVALERLAWEVATADPLAVPVVIKLLEYDGQPILDWIRLKLIETGEITLKREETADYLTNMAYNCCILLDGLNEVRPAYREMLNSEITRFALEYPRHCVIVTSRVQDESWRQLRQGSAFHETLVVQPITPDDAQKYLFAHLSDEDGAALWSGLDARMRELALIPLLLWLIKEAYLEAKAAAKGGAVRIPQNRGALYKSFVAKLLRRDDDRGLGRRFPESQRLIMLEKLALMMQKDKVLTLLREEVEEQFGSMELLDALLVNGFLVGDAQIRFAPHQTMQEHFAACALEREAVKNGKAEGLARRAAVFSPEMLNYAHDQWWWETFIQLTGLTEDGNALALALIEINPWLAWWCYEEGGRPDDQARVKIRNRSENLVYSPNVFERRGALSALLKLQTPRIKTYLLDMSVDEDPDISRTALQPLLEMGEDGIVAFLKTFEHRIKKLTPIQAAAWGRAVHDIDPRLGIGLRADGLPDIDWVTIPGGEFHYGHESERDNPPKILTLPPFQISRNLITYKQFQAFFDTPDGWENPEWWEAVSADDSHTAQPGQQRYKFWNHPRENVSWYDAVAFCRWLSAKLGHTVTLPTEHQYERAARWTDGRLYPYGNTFEVAKGNTRETGIEQTSAVGIFPQGLSVEGVHDLIGNVWEWCLNESPKPENIEVGDTNRHVLRGGSWVSNQDYARASSRLDYYPEARLYDIGFRLVRCY